MSDSDPMVPPGAGSMPPSGTRPPMSGTGSGTASTGTSQSQGTIDMAKDQAKHVGREAAEATGQVAHTAKDEAASVASEASAQAKSLFAESRHELTEQAEKQQRRVAEGLRSLGGELNTMAQHSESDSTASRLVSQAASKADDVASWLDARNPGSLVEEVKGFARQHPGAFIAIAAGAGLLVGRLTRSLMSDDGFSQMRV